MLLIDVSGKYIRRVSCMIDKPSVKIKSPIAAHIEKAIADGKPDVLTRVVGNDAKRANRKAALKDLPELPATHSWDEYPFASVKEGGKGASTAPVPRPEQDRQGGTMSEFYRQNNVGHNDQFRVGISPPP
jgi:hypothetical protein